MRQCAGQSGARLCAWTVVALGLLLPCVVRAAVQDITSRFAITRSGFALNRTTNTFDQLVTIRNASGGSIPAPIVVVVGGLAANVALANKAGQTSDGRPYVIPVLAGGALANGATLSLPLKFADPQRVPIAAALQILDGIDLPPDAPSLLQAVATGATSAFLVGRIVGASNLPVTLQASTSSACIAGALAGGSAAGAPVAATTDAAGYFGVAVQGVAPGSFVAVNVVAPTVTATSACLVSSRDNDSWPKAFPLDGSAPSAQDLVDAPGKARWYRFSVMPGQRIEVNLSGLPADYDLAVFKDIGKAFASQFNPSSATTADLVKLTAEYAPSVFSPSVFSPSVFSPSVFSPSVFSPDAYSPSVFSPSVFSPSVFSPSVFSPSVFSPSVFSPSVFSPSVFSPSVFSPSVFSPSVFSSQELAQAFSTAQTRSIISVSATPGTSDEDTVVNTWNNTGNFYVRVTGRNGAFDTAQPFTVSIRKGATTCAGVTDIASTPRSPVAASGLATIILTDSSALALDAPLDLPGGGTLRERLAAFAQRPEIAGVVIDVANDARVGVLKQQAARNPACPFAKNLVAAEIKAIVDAYRTNPLRYVVLVGNDGAIPFFRSPDESALGQESGYVPPVESNSTSEASLRLDYVLSQDGYGSKTSLSLRNSDFPVPDLAVGRLVESPNEIGGILDAYVTAGGAVAPKSALVTGYDFLADAAEAVGSELQQGMGIAPDSLITPNGKSPQDPASWTAAQLGQKLFGSRHDVIFLAGHFSANSALAADFATSVLTTDLAASTVDFTNSIVFSAGCHSGYNLVDADAITGVTQPLDWAQAFARKGATLIAGTGYQYGDTDFLAYSEQIYDNFARQLRAGSGAIAIGEALVKAKLDYLAITPDIQGLSEKALLEATLFGLPMLGVDMPSGRGAASGGGPAITPAAVASGPALSLGLKSYDLTVAPSLTSHTVSLRNAQGGADVVATWLSGPDGVVTRPGEPALPLAAVNVTPTDAKLVLRGVGLRGGAYSDVAPMFPFSGAPTTELRGVHFPFVSPTFYPARMWTPNYFGALAGGGGTELLVTPAQHRVASVADGTSTQRRFDTLALRLFYSGNLGQAALSDAPSIVAVEGRPDAGGVAFTAQVVGDPAAGIQQVWVTYTSDGANAWTSLDLAQCVAPLPAACGTTEDSRLWKGRLATGPPNLRYIVQAVNGVGLVAVDDNRGAYFGVVDGPPAPTTFALVSAPTSATFGDALVITGVLTSGGVPVGGKLVTINVGGTTQVGVTASDGTVTVQVPAAALVGSFQISAAFAGDEGSVASSVSAPLTVDKATASLAALAPVGATLTGATGGIAQPLAQESVAFSVDGPGGPRTIFAITDYLGQATLPPPGLPAGSYTVTQASFGGNATYAAASIALAQQFAVPKTPQSVTFAALGDKTFGDPDFQVFATASSTLPVSFAASGACTVTGGIVHLTGAGSCTITAAQPGDADYEPAEPVAQAFTIASNGKADQVITFDAAPSNVHVGDSGVTVSATSASPTAPPSGIPIVFSSLTSAICTTGGTNGASVTPVAVGVCTIAADQAGDATYNPAPQVTLSFDVAAAGSASAQFAATGSMQSARSDHTATLLEDGRVLVAGGFGAGGAVLDSAELYCPDNAQEPPSFLVCPAGQRGTFTATPTAMPVPAAGQTATRLRDGTVLLIGGANSNLQWFTPADQAWHASAPLALADRTFHTATLLASGRVFVAGGVNALGTTLGSTFLVDPTTDPWTIEQGPDLNFPREGHTATLLPDDTVLIAGGRRKVPIDFVVVGDYETYDPSVAGPLGNGAMIDETPMSTSRFWHAAEIAANRVVITGGSCDPATAVSSSLAATEFFSLTTGASAFVGCSAPAGASDLQQARRALTMTPLQDGSLLAIGGADGSGVPRSSSEIFLAGPGTFALGPSMGVARSEHRATLLLDGRVLVTGGVGAAGTPLASAEVFSSAAATGTTNQRPIADAGPDQNVTAGATVQLSGAGSSDPEGTALAYSWSFTSKPAGSVAHFSDANAVNPTFVADVQGVYLAQLIVSDAGIPPLDSAPDTVRIGAGDRAPVAAADAYSVNQDTTLVVDAASGVLANDTDADGDALTAILGTTVAHGALTLNADGSFTYAPSAGYSGPDGFTYHARDATLDSNTVSVSLSVNAIAVNHPPVADAGSAQTVLVGQPVQLGGICTDSDNDPTTSSWSFTSVPAGSAAALSGASSLAPTFTPDLAGGYGVQLVCNDGKVDGAPASVTITAVVGTITAGPVAVQPGGNALLQIGIGPAAPPGDLVVALSIADPSVAALATPTITIASGQTSGSATVYGVGVGSTTITVQAPGYASTQASVTTSGAPVVFSVTSLADAGIGSLRDAIAEANAAPGPNVVDLSGLSGTIVLTTGQIRIDGPLTIVGPGADVLAIDGSLNGRIFTIIENNAPACPALSGPSDFLVSISGLTLKNGSRNVADSGGGAIQSSKSLVLDDVVIRDSQAKSGGGLVFNAQYPGQVLVISRSQFIDNVAKPVVAGNTDAHNGGALLVHDYCDGVRIAASVAISASVFSGNRVQPVDLEGRGGAIAAYLGAGALLISDTRIVDNHVEPPSPPVAGMSYPGGGIETDTKLVTIQRSEIAGDSADTGGGMQIAAPDPDLQTPASAFVFQLVDSTVSGNVANRRTGGVDVYGNVAALVANSTVAANSAPATFVGGIRLNAGATLPPSASNTAQPTLQLVSSIVADSLNGSVDLGHGGGIASPFAVDASNALVENADADIVMAAATNVFGVDPQLGALALNGGPTRTHALLAGSPAIDAGSNPLNLATDQRGDGFARVAGAAADMGAFESAATVTLVPTITGSTPASIRRNQRTGVHLTGTNLSGAAVASVDPALAVANVVASATTVDFTVDVPPDATLGPRDFDVTTAGGTAVTSLQVISELEIAVLPAPIALPPDGLDRTYTLSVSGSTPSAQVFTLAAADATVLRVGAPTVTLPANATQVAFTLAGLTTGSTQLLVAAPAATNATGITALVGTDTAAVNAMRSPVVGLSKGDPTRVPAGTAQQVAAPAVGLSKGDPTRVPAGTAQQVAAPAVGLSKGDPTRVPGGTAQQITAAVVGLSKGDPTAVPAGQPIGPVVARPVGLNHL